MALRGPYKKPTPSLKLKCSQCGKKFLGIRPSRRFCSNLCRHRAVVPLKPPPAKKKCSWCGKIFQPKLEKRRFCSDRCGHRDYTERNRSNYNRRMRELNYKTRVATPWKLPIASAKLRARKEGLEFDLTYDWGRDGWTGKCSVSGLSFVILPKAPRTLFSPTIDRVIPTLGYVRSNCRFVLWSVNAFKQNGTDADVLKIARGIVSTSDVGIF